MDGTDRTYRPELNDSYNSEWAVCLFRSPLRVESRALSVAGLTCPLQWDRVLIQFELFTTESTEHTEKRSVAFTLRGRHESVSGDPRFNSCVNTNVACAGMTS